ncbi:MAG: AbrB family transcriptional regulator [Clostridiales bacterium]|nr:AbrB family transcriptional regulator [Clostridiales bacterium]
MSNTSHPEGRFLAPVKVGPKGQIVIPAEVREMFGIHAGDILLLLADKMRGIAIPDKAQTRELYQKLTAQIFPEENA